MYRTPVYISVECWQYLGHFPVLSRDSASDCSRVTCRLHITSHGEICTQFEPQFLFMYVIRSIDWRRRRRRRRWVHRICLLCTTGLIKCENEPASSLWFLINMFYIMFQTNYAHSRMLILLLTIPYEVCLCTVDYKHTRHKFLRLP